ncbi:hypothetical protein L1049_020254 [Liquidambar formosana]|uniref:MACPF domain-containing protein n=1 Tax=Liquidambar formosana TaxID=63359 RepID=A0AAP0S762_LIQFO
MAGKASAAALRAAEVAIESIGLGYDIANDLRLKYCKKSSVDPRLVAIGDDQLRHIAIPGNISIPNVSKSIKCDKGERMRHSSDVLSFQQMSEQFNQEISLSGKIPSGQFNAAFDFSGSWQKDAANTKTLAFDAVYMTLYSIALEKSQIVLRDHVKQAVPSSWDPAALARFIEKYGTHVIVGVKMGGKDIVYVKQQHSSPLQPADVQKRLKDMADKRFIDTAGHSINPEKVYEKEKFETREHKLTFMDISASSSYSHKEEITFICKRRGGSTNKNLTHYEWCHTVQSEPDVISMSFIPITSLLSGIHGSGFLSHAINLYLRYKPPVEELHQFLEFQLPRQWAPVFGELALGPERKQQSSASLQFSLMGPKLYVNTTLVDVGKRPVTGLRLYLEGKRSNCLAIHLQHLSSLPKTFQLHEEPNGNISRPSYDRRYYEKVQWKSFSHVCTAPVESEEDLSVVTGAHFEVGDSGLKKVLFLRLHFSKVIGAAVVRKPEWDGSPGLTHKSGIISTLISTRFSVGQKPPPRPAEVNINSAVYPGGPPVPTQTPKLLRFVDTTEMTRGPQDSPGYWVVSGARLIVEKGKISLKVKYSLLTVILPDEEVAEF